MNRHYSLQHNAQSAPVESGLQLPRSAPAQQAVFAREEPYSESGRPALSVFTTVSHPQLPQKAPTPLVSPWIDAAITPSRYIDGRPWERYS